MEAGDASDQMNDELKSFRGVLNEASNTHQKSGLEKSLFFKEIFLGF